MSRRAGDEDRLVGPQGECFSQDVLGRFASACDGRDLTAVGLSKLQSRFERVFAKNIGDERFATYPGLCFASGVTSMRKSRAGISGSRICFMQTRMFMRALKFAVNKRPAEIRRSGCIFGGLFAGDAAVEADAMRNQCSMTDGMPLGKGHALAGNRLGDDLCLPRTLPATDKRSAAPPGATPWALASSSPQKSTTDHMRISKTANDWRTIGEASDRLPPLMRRQALRSTPRLIWRSSRYSMEADGL